MRRIARAPAVAFGMLLLGHSVGMADTIVLKNGNRLEGRITKERPSEITILVNGMEMSIDRASIQEIRRPGPEAFPPAPPTAPAPPREASPPPPPGRPAAAGLPAPPPGKDSRRIHAAQAEAQRAWHGSPDQKGKALAELLDLAAQLERRLDSAHADWNSDFYDAMDLSLWAARLEPSRPEPRGLAARLLAAHGRLLSAASDASRARPARLTDRPRVEDEPAQRRERIGIDEIKAGPLVAPSYRFKPLGATAYQYQKEPPPDPSRVTDVWRLYGYRSSVLIWSNGGAVTEYAWMAVDWDDDAREWTFPTRRAKREIAGRNLSRLRSERMEFEADIRRLEDEIRGLQAGLPPLYAKAAEALREPDPFVPVRKVLAEIESAAERLDSLERDIAALRTKVEAWAREAGRLEGTLREAGGDPAAVPTAAPTAVPVDPEAAKKAERERAREIADGERDLRLAQSDLETIRRRIEWLEQMLRRPNMRAEDHKRLSEEKSRKQQEAAAAQGKVLTLTRALEDLKSKTGASP